jgi:hypothetical protein
MDTADNTVMKWLKGPMIGPRAYFLWGASLMAVKYNIDRVIADFVFHKSWFFWNYIRPSGLGSIDAVPPSDRRFYYFLLLTALPFLFLGLVLTLRRLKSAALQPAWCLLFFVPVVNLIFFTVLCVLPEVPASGIVLQSRGLQHYMPKSAGACALLSVVIVSIVAYPLVMLCVYGLQNYGWGLFVGVPFTMGMLSVLLYAGPQPRDFKSCITVAVMPVLIVGGILLALAAEGVICLLMAAPIGIVVAAFGGWLGWAITQHTWRRATSQSLCIILAAAPLASSFEHNANVMPPVFAVSTPIVIDAPPEKVWPDVVCFTEITEPLPLILRAGVAYPIKSRIDGTGVHAIRHCIFNTGEFVEPIETWDPPNLLHFGVTRQPEPIEELSPYPHLKTPHLDGYFYANEGEFRMTRLPGGRTLLVGTTWYSNRMWPAPYWKLWSEYIIHKIHVRVLEHIKNMAEAPNIWPHVSKIPETNEIERKTDP